MLRKKIMMRNYKIDILRGISILLVLMHHFNIPYKLHDTWLGVVVFGEALSTLIARNGNYGVTMFFVISGFLITQHSLNRDGALNQLKIRNFYVRRIARIIPCLVLLVAVVSLLGSFGLVPFLNQAPNGVQVSYGWTLFAAFTFWMNILIIEYGWVNYALGVLWSLSVEEVFYLVFPLLCLTLTRVKALLVFLVGIILYAPYFRSLHFAEESGAYLYHYFSSFDGIAMGCITALICQKVYLNPSVAARFSVLIVFLMLAVYFYAPIKAVSTWSISAFALLAAALIFCFAQQPQKLAQHWYLKFMVWVGQRSYEMYLFHLIILGIMKVIYFPKTTLPEQKLVLLVVFLSGTFILSALIEKYYSTPLNRKIRQKWISE